MGLTDLYRKGERILREKDYGWVLDAVETGFILEHDRRILDRYTFRPRYIDGVEPKTACRVLGVELATPVIMSAMTMPIPAITETGLMDVAEGLKESGSFMWTGTPTPKNLKELVASDVLKGLAFGASLVGLGRPILCGLAAEGRDGVRELMAAITAEMKRIMSLIGAEEPGRLTLDMLVEDP